MYIRNNVGFKIRDDLTSDNYESLWAELLLPHTEPITIGVCYRPPVDTPFLEKFESTLSTLDPGNESIILGDMNITYNDNSGPTRQYKQILSIHNYKQLISTPTRITESTANILDHITCHREDKITQSGVTETGISDYYRIYCTRKHNRHKTGQHNTIKIRSLRNYNKQTYANILRRKQLGMGNHYNGSK